MRDIINGILWTLVGMTLLTGIGALYVGISYGDGLMILLGIVDLVIVIGTVITFKT